jgi:hypothetical protein
MGSKNHLQIPRAEARGFFTYDLHSQVLARYGNPLRGSVGMVQSRLGNFYVNLAQLLHRKAGLERSPRFRVGNSQTNEPLV